MHKNKIFQSGIDPPNAFYNTCYTSEHIGSQLSHPCPLKPHHASWSEGWVMMVTRWDEGRCCTIDGAKITRPSYKDMDICPFMWDDLLFAIAVQCSTVTKLRSHCSISIVLTVIQLCSCPLDGCSGQNTNNNDWLLEKISFSLYLYSLVRMKHMIEL